MTDTKPSPLTEAKVESLQELFSRDPLEMTRQNRDQIVKILRAQRVEFAKEEAKPKAKRQKLEQAPAGVSLKDLGL